MELRYKPQKIRDLIAYDTNVVPVDVDIERHDVYITVYKKDLEMEGKTEKDIEESLQKLIQRRVTVKVI